MKKALFIFIGLVFLISSCTFDECTSKSLYLTAFDNFVAKVERKHNDFKEKDWDKADERFKKLTEKCYKKFEDELTAKDKKRIVKNGIKYTLYRVKSEFSFDIDFNSKKWDEFFDGINGFIDKEDDLAELFQKLTNDKDFLKGIDNFEEAFDKLGKGLDRLGKGLDKLGKGLDKMFENFNKKEK